jgi:hypothetical protein
MNIKYQKPGVPKIKDKAISVCLYSSPRLDLTKHISPLIEYMANPDPDYDLLIFHDGSVALPESTKARMFLVESDQTGFQKHLWRYFGAFEQYGKIWFRGTDTPRIPLREKRLEQIMDICRLDLLMWTSEPYRCTGRIALSDWGCSSLADRLTRESPPQSHWHCDEEFLSNWTRSQPIRALLAADAPYGKGSKASTLVSELMESGNHTVIIKDRDDSSSRL